MSEEPLNEPSGMHEPVQPPRPKRPLGERVRDWWRRLTGK